MKLKKNKFFIICIIAVLLLIGISFYTFYQPYLKSVNDYKLIKENCYEKKNVNHEACSSPLASNEDYLERYIKDNYAIQRLNDLDAITVSSSIVRHEAFSYMQFLSPLLVIIAVVGTIHSEYNSGMFKNYLTRMSYKKYLLRNIRQF